MLIWEVGFILQEKDRIGQKGGVDEKRRGRWRPVSLTKQNILRRHTLRLLNFDRVSVLQSSREVYWVKLNSTLGALKEVKIRWIHPLRSDRMEGRDAKSNERQWGLCPRVVHERSELQRTPPVRFVFFKNSPQTKPRCCKYAMAWAFINSSRFKERELKRIKALIREARVTRKLEELITPTKSEDKDLNFICVTSRSCRDSSPHFTRWLLAKIQIFASQAYIDIYNNGV